VIEFLIDLFLMAPQILLRHPGNFFLHYVFRRDVDLDDDSFSAYALGALSWLILILLVLLIIYL
jgi:hypothetical protein